MGVFKTKPVGLVGKRKVDINYMSNIDRRAKAMRRATSRKVIRLPLLAFVETLKK